MDDKKHFWFIYDMFICVMTVILALVYQVGGDKIIFVDLLLWIYLRVSDIGDTLREIKRMMKR